MAILHQVKIGIPEDCYQVLAAYKKHTGVAPATFIRQVVEQATPSLLKINEALDAVNNQQSLVASKVLQEVLTDEEKKIIAAYNELSQINLKDEEEQGLK